MSSSELLLTHGGPEFSPSCLGCCCYRGSSRSLKLPDVWFTGKITPPHRLEGKGAGGWFFCLNSREDSQLPAGISQPQIEALNLQEPGRGYQSQGP